MKEAIEDTSMIAKCGLYCGSCGRYLKGKCPGCAENDKAAKWCKTRNCCIEKDIPSCADCKEYIDVMACSKYNNFMAKIFGFVFNSDRSACIKEIRTVGYDQFAKTMAEEKRMTFKRK